MEKVILNSSAIKSAEYADGAMIVTFHRGASYSYNVPLSIFRALTTADSVGRFFSAHVRRQYIGTKL